MRKCIMVGRENVSKLHHSMKGRETAAGLYNRARLRSCLLRSAASWQACTLQGHIHTVEKRKSNAGVSEAPFFSYFLGLRPGCLRELTAGSSVPGPWRLGMDDHPARRLRVRVQDGPTQDSSASGVGGRSTVKPIHRCYYFD